MIDTTTLNRPGLTAIAAVLALSSTAAMAQVATPDVASPALAPVSAAPAEAAPVTAPVQTVQTTPATPTLPELAVAPAPAAQPASPSRVAAPRGSAVERSRQIATPAARAAVAPSTDAPTSVAVRTPERAPVTQVSAARASDQDVAPTVPLARTEAAVSDEMGYASWVLLGGGLLIVAGGAAFAMRRRPRRGDDLRTEPVAFQPASEPVSVNKPSVPAAAPIAAQTAMDRNIVRADVAESRQSAVAARTPVDPSDRHAMLEAMIAEAPTDSNPFHSRRNRLRRADYLLRTGQVETVSTATEAVREPAVTGSDRWSEMRFAGKQNSRVSWGPVIPRRT